MHVGTRRAREAESADSDCEGEDCPEERGKWECEETCEEREAAALRLPSSGAHAEVSGLQKKSGKYFSIC